MNLPCRAVLSFAQGIGRLAACVICVIVRRLSEGSRGLPELYLKVLTLSLNSAMTACEPAQRGHGADVTSDIC